MIRSKVEIAPISSSGYADYIDVTDKVNMNGISKITKSIDSSDYSFGIFTFSDLTLTAKNSNGYFNINDSRSIFSYGRNKSKVKISFVEFDDNPFNDDTTSIFFEGIINDEATRLDLMKNTITFAVLSLDSIFRTLKVTGGSISNNTTVKNALVNILDRTEVTNILNVDSNNINPDLDIEIDSGSEFTNETLQDAVNELLLISNSCLIIDSSNNIIIKKRESSSLADALNLYGANDIHRRENILNIESYNDGYHRSFPSVTVNNVNYTNTGYAEDYGFRNKSITINSITTESKNLQIATRLAEEFKAPKIELEVEVKTSLAKTYDILDPVSVSFPYKIEPQENNFFPIVGVATIGDSETPLPKFSGSIEISNSIAFKILEIEHDVKKFTTKLKLRQSGIATGDGFFYEAPIVGFAKIGSSILQEDASDYNLDYVPSVLGGAIINGISST